MGDFSGVVQVNLFVRNLNEAVAWYMDNLGLQLEVKFEEGIPTAVLNFGEKTGTKICLIETEDKSAVTNQGTHPVLGLTKEAVDTYYEKLKNNGVKVEENPNHKAHFKFWDLDGNLVEAFWPNLYQ